MGHWQDRVQERIGNVCPQTLANGLAWAIKNDRRDLVSYVGRANKKGSRRVFGFRVPDGRTFYVMMKTPELIPITVFDDGMDVKGPDGKFLLGGSQ